VAGAARATIRRSEATEDIQRSGRERGEGFPTVLVIAAAESSERGEGFPALLVIAPLEPSERGEGFLALPSLSHSPENYETENEL
jgi:hypothetical protein